MEKNKKEQDARMFLEKLSELDQLINNISDQTKQSESGQTDQLSISTSEDSETNDLKWLKKCFW